MRIILLLAMLGIPAWGLAAPAWMDTVAADGRRTGCLMERLVIAPFRASGKDWVIAGGMAAGIAVISAFDPHMRGQVSDLNQVWTGTVDDAGHAFQRIDMFLGTTGAIYLGGLATGRPAMRRVGTELAAAFAVAVAGTQLVKFTVGRARPDQGDGPGHYVGPTTDDQFHSLWSGDVTKAFVLASVLSAEAKHPVVTVLLYSLASATAFQRLHSDRHWFSDVVSAAVWSTAVGIGTVKINKKLKMKN